MLGAILTLVAIVPCVVTGLTCYSCTDSTFKGEPAFAGNCFSPSSSTFSPSCPNASDSYCQTQFTFEDGIVTGLARRCAQGRTDYDSSTSAMPSSNKCTTSLSVSSYSNPVDTTSCYYHCNSDKCNDVSVSTLKSCNSNCSRVSGWRSSYYGGFCDYISGKCVCNSGYTGPNCENQATTTPTPKRRMCVQCNSETDKGCTSKTEGSNCPGSERFCSAVKTSIFAHDEVVRTVLIRGCTDSYVAVDECKFTDIYSDTALQRGGYKEYTCYSTCDTDNCNTNTPNGKIDGTEKRRLYCHQCSSSSSDCSGLKHCESDETHCTSTVKYIISKVNDRNFEATSPSSYDLQSVSRQCATKGVTTRCTETEIGDLGFKKVTCEQSCQEDGCNVGWPARPKCIQCYSSTKQYGHDLCLKFPSSARDCSNPYEKYCVIQDVGLQEGTRASLDGYPRRIYRGCSYINLGTGCTKKTIRDKVIQTCNYTCESDGCNVGSGSRAPYAVPHFIFGLYALLLVWMV